VPVAEAVDRQVHADLADATERRESQFVGASTQFPKFISHCSAFSNELRKLKGTSKLKTSLPLSI
jgi:hypothetical protein